MNEPAQTIDHESRWAPALAILVMLIVLAVLPGHVHVLPVWVSYAAALAILIPMIAVTFTRGNTLWLRIERTMIILAAAAYVADVTAELVDMVGLITLHPGTANAFSLLSSSVAIWTVNVLMFALLYWQIDRGGPLRSSEQVEGKAGLGFSTTFVTRGSADRLAPGVPRLSLSWIQHGHGVQSHRCGAAYASCEDVDDDRKHDLAFDDGCRSVARH